MKDHGISHRLSYPYTSKQNGTSERKHKHLVETALSLLKTTSLPEKFWDEVVCAAAYLINRLISPNLNHKSSYKTLFNQKPNYKFLKSLDAYVTLIYEPMHLTN